MNKKLYSIADKIRSKLLLSIDKEIILIQNKNFENHRFPNKNIVEETQNFITIEMSFSHNNSTTEIKETKKNQSTKNPTNILNIDNSDKLSQMIIPIQKSCSLSTCYDSTKYVDNTPLKQLNNKFIFKNSMKYNLSPETKTTVINEEKIRRRKSLPKNKKTREFFPILKESGIISINTLSKKSNLSKYYLKELCLGFKKFLTFGKLRTNSYNKFSSRKKEYLC